MRTPRSNDDRTVEALLAGRHPAIDEPSAPLAEVVAAIRELGEGPMPEPSGALAAILTEGVRPDPVAAGAGLATEKGDSPATAGSNATGPARRVAGLPKWRKVPTMFTSLIAWLAGLGSAAKAGVALSAAGALVAGGAAVDLPSAVSDALDRNRLVEEVQLDATALDDDELPEEGAIEPVEEETPARDDADEVTEDDADEVTEDDDADEVTEDDDADADEGRPADPGAEGRARAEAAGGNGASSSEAGRATATERTAGTPARIPAAPGPGTGEAQREQAPGRPADGEARREEAPAAATQDQRPATPPQREAAPAPQPAPQAQPAPRPQPAPQPEGEERGADARESAPNGPPADVPAGPPADRGPRG